MKNLSQVKDYVFANYIKEQYEGLNKLAGLSKDEVNNISYDKVEDIIESTDLSGTESIAKGVGYKEGYQDALYGVLEYFSNIAAAEEAQAENPENPGRNVYTSVDIESMLKKLLNF